LEGAICRFGYKVGIKYNLSSANKWIDRESQHDLGGYAEDVRDAPIEKMKGVSSIG